jgi:lipopolysaccharide assembly protein A
MTQAAAHNGRDELQPAVEPGQPAVEPSGPTASQQLQPHQIKRTRVSSVWAGVALFAVILLLLLIFILENGKTVSVSFFGASGHLPLGVALSLAAVLGVLLVVVPGTARIIQLRLTARRHRELDVRSDATVRVPE